MFAGPNDELYVAILSQNAADVREALDAGAYQNYYLPETENTMLHIAASLGFEEGVRLLLAEGAVVEPLNGIGSTPADLAALGGHEAIVRLLELEKLRVPVVIDVALEIAEVEVEVEVEAEWQGIPCSVKDEVESYIGSLAKLLVSGLK